MWPLSAIRERREHRRYTAAVVLFLSAATFKRLDSSTRARVDTEINRFPLWSIAPFPAVALRKWSTWDVLAAERAIAMARLRIQPILEGASWEQLLEPWSFQRQMLVGDFRPMALATVRAKAYLLSKGIGVSESDPWGDRVIDGTEPD